MTRRRAERPVAAAGGIVLRGDEVLLIQRAVDPFAGRWSIPGGAVERGERVVDAVVREVQEEAGVVVDPVALVGVYDRIVEEEGEVRYHFVLADYLCRYVDGALRAATDARDARWVPLDDLDRYDLTSTTRAAIARAVEIRSGER